MNTELDTQKTPLQWLWGELSRLANPIQKILPGALRAETFIGKTYLYARMNPKILGCRQDSILNAIMRAASLGLMPDGSGSCYLVPYKGSLTMIPGYKGLIDLMRRCAGVEMIETAIVRDCDQFEFSYGTAQHKMLRHVPNLNDSREKIVVAAYAILTFKSGLQQYEVMPAWELNKIRDSSRGYDEKDDGCVWNLHYGQMCRKTLVRRVANYVPMSAALALALDLDTQADRGEEQDVPGAVTVETVRRDAEKHSDNGAGGEVKGVLFDNTPAKPEWARLMATWRTAKGLEISAVASEMGVPVELAIDWEQGIENALPSEGNARRWARITGGDEEKLMEAILAAV